MSSPRSAPELSSVSTAQWDEARRVLPVIRGLAGDPNRTRAHVVAAGAALAATLPRARAASDAEAGTQGPLFHASGNTGRQTFGGRTQLCAGEICGSASLCARFHTDEPHPHVHMVLKAMTEGWEYHLNIRKPTLRNWRKEFARHLHAQGVAAKATRRGVPKNTRPGNLRGIFRSVHAHSR
jgi:hypothetical protein